VVFIPVAGVIIIDHFLIRPSVYRVTQVEDDQPINRPALVAWLAGAAIALAGSEGLIASITSVAALDSAIASGLIYALVTRVWKVRP
jgi:purine-cytosine permease-like protein